MPRNSHKKRRKTTEVEAEDLNLYSDISSDSHDRMREEGHHPDLEREENVLDDLWTGKRTLGKEAQEIYDSYYG